MTKTNLERIEEEFDEKFGYLEDVQFSNGNYGGSAFDPRKDIKEFWLSKLQQRMDEIEAQVHINSHKVKEGEFIWKKDILNIIKSVDKSK